VFFDAGGTLIRAWPGVGEVYARTAAALGHPADPAAFDARLPGAWRAYQERAEREGLPTATSDAADEAMWRAVTRVICDGIPDLRGMDFDRWFRGVADAFGSGACWQVFPEAREVLEACRARGLRCGIVSNWSSRLRRILDDHGLTAQFDFVQISALEGCRKPDREFYARALARAGVAAAEALHVGDTYADDAAGAAAAGLLGVHLDRKGAGSPDGNGTPVVRDLRGILDYLG
jgi:putative hydrolase of the HAD superfamily